MIPPDYDDGFCRVVAGVLIRPMLYEQKKQYGEDTSRYLDEAFAPPYVLFPERHQSMLHGERQVILKQVMSYRSDQESADWREIQSAIGLQVTNPGLLKISCDTCKEFIVDVEQGKMYKPPGCPSNIARQPGVPVPCDAGRECAKGHWSRPVTFGTLPQKVWGHYWRMKSARRPAPACPIIMRNWAFMEWLINGRAAELDPMAVGTARRPA
jgi:hypothetical protein